MTIPTPVPTPAPGDLNDGIKIVGSILGLIALAAPTLTNLVEKWFKRRQPEEELRTIKISNDSAQAVFVQNTLEAANKAVENYNKVLGRLLQLEGQVLEQRTQIQTLEKQDREKTDQIQSLMRDKQVLAIENEALTRRVTILEQTLRDNNIPVPIGDTR